MFAPTNEAFATLLAGTVDGLLKPENKDKPWLTVKDGKARIKNEAGGMAMLTIANVIQSNGVFDHGLLPKM